MSDNKLLNHVIEQRKGHYCHALEHSNVSELESTIEALVDEFREDFTQEEILDFFNSISLYHLEDESLSETENKASEEELYSFNIEGFINELY